MDKTYDKITKVRGELIMVLLINDLETAEKKKRKRKKPIQRREAGEIIKKNLKNPGDLMGLTLISLKKMRNAKSVLKRLKTKESSIS